VSFEDIISLPNSPDGWASFHRKIPIVVANLDLEHSENASEFITTAMEPERSSLTLCISVACVIMGLIR